MDQEEAVKVEAGSLSIDCGAGNDSGGANKELRCNNCYGRKHTYIPCTRKGKSLTQSQLDRETEIKRRKWKHSYCLNRTHPLSFRPAGGI